MTSTSVTKVGGVVVVTQVIPQDDASIPLRTADTATQALPLSTPATPPHKQSPPTKPADMTAVFLWGEPQGLGIVQIFIGVMCILFSLTAAYSHILMVHAPLCLAVIFVVSGSLAVVAVRQTSVRLVWASLLWNMMSVMLSLVGVAYVSWLLASRRASERLCDSSTLVGAVLTDEDMRCIERMWILDVSVYGLLGLLLVLLVLQVCVTVTVCVFSAKAIRRHRRYAPILVEVDVDSALLCPAAPAYDSEVALLDSIGEETSRLPTNTP